MKCGETPFFDETQKNFCVGTSTGSCTDSNQCEVLKWQHLQISFLNHLPKQLIGGGAGEAGDTSKSAGGEGCSGGHQSS